MADRPGAVPGPAPRRCRGAGAGGRGARGAPATRSRCAPPNSTRPIPAAGHGLVFQLRTGRACCAEAARRPSSPGKDPAIGGPYIARHAPAGASTILDGQTLQPLNHLTAVNANAISISARWLAWRAGGRAATRSARARSRPAIAQRGRSESRGRAAGRCSAPPASTAPRSPTRVASSGRNSIVRKGPSAPGAGHAVVASRLASLHLADAGTRPPALRAGVAAGARA